MEDRAKAFAETGVPHTEAMLSLEQWRGTRYDPNRSIFMVRYAVHAFENKADLLGHYLALNAGGTPHTQTEIDRVREMRERKLMGRAADPAAKTSVSGPKMGWAISQFNIIHSSHTRIGAGK